MPLLVLIEHRGLAPMLDLDIFRNRMLAAATGAALAPAPSACRVRRVFGMMRASATFQGDDG